MTTHHPRRHRWPLTWLPDSCSCGLPRYDRCPDVLADQVRGGNPHAPLGGPTVGKPRGSGGIRDAQTRGPVRHRWRA